MGKNDLSGMDALGCCRLLSSSFTYAWFLFTQADKSITGRDKGGKVAFSTFGDDVFKQLRDVNFSKVRPCDVEICARFAFCDF